MTSFGLYSHIKVQVNLQNDDAHVTSSEGLLSHCTNSAHAEPFKLKLRSFHFLCIMSHHTQTLVLTQDSLNDLRVTSVA